MPRSMKGEDNKLQKMERIRIGISGYGNLGKGVELAAAQNPDIELVAIFTRRNRNMPQRAQPLFIYPN